MSLLKKINNNMTKMTDEYKIDKYRKDVQRKFMRDYRSSSTAISVTEGVTSRTYLVYKHFKQSLSLQLPGFAMREEADPNMRENTLMPRLGTSKQTGKIQENSRFGRRRSDARKISPT